MSEIVRHSRNAQILTGRLAEYQELLDLLAERPGLTIVSADPWSGTSDLLHSATEELMGPRVIVDARSCADGLDLAMAIADAAVSSLAPEALSWWLETAPPASASGLSLSRSLSKSGIDIDAMRHGSGLGMDRLREAFDLMATLAGGYAVLVVDHLGLVLAVMAPGERGELLGELRAARQRFVGLDMVLVEHRGGQLSMSLKDDQDPLYRAGQVLEIRRPLPERFALDLAVTRAWTDVPVEMLRGAAELTAGVPALTWQVIELADPRSEELGSQVLAGWTRLRELTALSTARQWDLLRRVHPVAFPIVAAMGVGLRPHAVSANPKSVNEALKRLRGLGAVWQPQKRRWSLSNPLLAAWAREHEPSWVRRLSRSS